MPASDGTRDLRAERDGAPGDGSSKRKGRRLRRLPWWLAHFLDWLSPGAVVAMLGILVIAAGLMGARHLVQENRETAYSEQPESYAPVSYEGEVSPQWGQQLGALEELRYRRFGLPLHYGPSGVPLIEVERTGDVRELTEMEMEFPHDVNELSVPGAPGVVYAPGATGHGVRWREPVKYRDVPASRGVDRITWFKEQERLLNGALRDVNLVVAQVALVPPGAWDKRWAEDVQASVDAVNEKYVAGDPDQWMLAGYRIRCNRQLDLEYRQGLTEGCPTAAYRDAVAMVWLHLGNVVDTVRRLAEAELLESNAAFRRFYEDADIEGYQRRQLEAIESGMQDVAGSVQRLKVYGDAEGHYVHVTLD